MPEPPARISNRFFDCPQGDKPLADYQPGAWLAAPPAGRPPAADGQHRPPTARPGSGRSQPDTAEVPSPKGPG
jgi:hypothetical protein